MLLVSYIVADFIIFVVILVVPFVISLYFKKHFKREVKDLKIRTVVTASNFNKLKVIFISKTS